MTPTVAHKNTNRSTPMRRSHRRVNEGRAAGAGADSGAAATGTNGLTGDLYSPTPVVWLAKGSLGSEIIARVVVS